MSIRKLAAFALVPLLLLSVLNINPHAEAAGDDKLTLRIKTYADNNYSTEEDIFTQGEDIWVEVELVDFAKVCATGLEAIQFRIIYSTALGESEYLLWGPAWPTKEGTDPFPYPAPGELPDPIPDDYVFDNMSYWSFNSNHVEEGDFAGFHGPSFNGQNQYYPELVAGVEVRTARPLLADGELVRFKVPIPLNAPDGIYTLSFSTESKDASLVTYDGPLDNPEDPPAPQDKTTNKSPVTNYIDFQSAQVIIGDAVGSVQGTVNLPGREDNSGVEVKLFNKADDTNTGISVNTAINGTFDIQNVPAGEYVVRFWRSTYLISKRDVAVVVGETVTLPASVNMRAGDVNNDGIINVQDLQLMAASYGANSAAANYNANADLNGDGIVNVQDLQLLAVSYGQSGD